MPVEMTENDKKKEFLRRYRECERREQEILEEIQRLRADLAMLGVFLCTYKTTNKRW